MKKWNFIACTTIIVFLIMVLEGIFVVGITKYEYKKTFGNSFPSHLNVIDDLFIECNYDYNKLTEICCNDDIDLTVISNNGIVLNSFDKDSVGNIFSEFNTLKNETPLDDLTFKPIFINKANPVYVKYVDIPSKDGVYLLVKGQHFCGSIEFFGICAVTLAALVACVLAAALLYIFYKKNLLNPTEKFKDFANEVSKGNYNKKIDIGDLSGNMRELADSFNIMCDILAYTVNEVSLQNTKLQSVLNSMTEGVLAIDNDDKIMFINPAVCKLFKIDLNCSGKLVFDVIHARYVLRLIKKTMEQKSPAEMEIVVNFSSPQIINIRTSQIADEKGNLIGVILVAEDITHIRKLEKMRTEFASNVSHELKTPLTSIIGFVDSLKNGAIEDKDTARRFLDIIAFESDRLYRLIQDILELSSIENSEYDSNKTETDLKVIANQIKTLLTPKAEKKGLTFKFDVQNDLPLFYCNGDRFHQLFLNLCDNAIKYTEKGGAYAKLYKKDNNLIFIVSDTGIGIPEHSKNRIYERFYRVDKGRSRQMGGTGLGLSIVKHIVLLYDGSIEINSKVKKGTEFIVKIPFNHREKQHTHL